MSKTASVLKARRASKATARAEATAAKIEIDALKSGAEPVSTPNTLMEQVRASARQAAQDIDTTFSLRGMFVGADGKVDTKHPQYKALQIEYRTEFVAMRWCIYTKRNAPIDDAARLHAKSVLAKSVNGHPVDGKAMRTVEEERWYRNANTRWSRLVNAKEWDPNAPKKARAPKGTPRKGTVKAENVAPLPAAPRATPEIKAPLDIFEAIKRQRAEALALNNAAATALGDKFPFEARTVLTRFVEDVDAMLASVHKAEAKAINKAKPRKSRGK